MPRFTVKDLLLATTLAAIGAGLIASLFHGFDKLQEFGVGGGVVALLLWFGGGALIGADLFTPFKRITTGAIVGLATQVVISSFGW
jgi:hypothetical protein